MRTVLVVWASAAMAAAAGGLLYRAGVRINTTPSVPVGIWRLSRMPRTLERGRVVGVCVPDTALFRAARAADYIGGGECPGDFEVLFKPVAAVGGDIVTIDTTGVRVNGRLILNSVPLRVDGRGRPLPQVPAGRYTVAPGTLWLVSDWTPRSFDSRYWAALPATALRAVARPVWTFAR